MTAVTPLPWWGTFLCAGLGACTAELATLPVDTTKVRLQLLQRTVRDGATAAAPNMFRMASKIVQEEGAGALYKGLWPAMHRQLLFASLRVGLYGQVRNMPARNTQRYFAWLRDDASHSG